MLSGRDGEPKEWRNLERVSPQGWDSDLTGEGVVDGDIHWMLKIGGLPGPELPHSHQTSRKYPSGVQAGRSWREGIAARASKPKALPWGRCGQDNRQAHKRGWETGSPLTRRAAWGPECVMSTVGAPQWGGRWTEAKAVSSSSDYVVWTSSWGRAALDFSTHCWQPCGRSEGTKQQHTRTGKRRSACHL